MISVIVPVYNVEKYIHRCVDSILGQTYADFELILVDDGSPDNCGVICDEYAAKDNRIVVIHQKNGGLSAARNAGLDWVFANSDSQWLNFVDSDDWVHPEYLERLLDAVLMHNVNISICGYAQTDGKEPEVIQDTSTSILWRTEDFYVKHNINATVSWGKLFRKECFEKIRFPEGKIHEDAFTTYKILFEHDVLAVICAPLYFYYANPNGITRSAFRIKRYDEIQATEERIAYFNKHGYSDIAKMELRHLECDIALFAIAARKAKIYSSVPSKYRIGWFKAVKTLKKHCSRDQFEWVMFRYHPHLIKLWAVCHRIWTRLNYGKESNE